MNKILKRQAKALNALTKITYAEWIIVRRMVNDAFEEKATMMQQETNLVKNASMVKQELKLSKEDLPCLVLMDKCSFLARPKVNEVKALLQILILAGIWDEDNITKTECTDTIEKIVKMVAESRILYEEKEKAPS